MMSWKTHLALGKSEITQKVSPKILTEWPREFFEDFNYGFDYSSGALEIKTKEILTEIPGNLVDAKCNDTLPQFDAIPSEFDEVPS